jgi:HSP20 family protein
MLTRQHDIGALYFHGSLRVGVIAFGVRISIGKIAENLSAYVRLALGNAANLEPLTLNIEPYTLPLTTGKPCLFFNQMSKQRKEGIQMATWDVFRELDNLRKEIDEAFRGAGMGRPFGPTFLSPVTTRRFPPVNFSEDEGHVYVEALLPGVDPKDIDLSVLRNTITISGERKPFVEKEGQIVHRSELGSGSFSRTLELPVDIDPNNITALCKDGIMQVTLPKAEHAKAKKIDIKIP